MWFGISVIFRIVHTMVSQFEERANIQFYVWLGKPFSQICHMIWEAATNKVIG